MSLDKNELNNTDKKEIKVFLEIDYNNYKNKIKKYILNHFKLINEIYNEEFNDNLIKMYILQKKKLLEKNHINFICALIDFSNYLFNLDFVDQEEYFLVILKIINILLLFNKLSNLNQQKEENEQIEFDKVELIGNKYINLIDLNLIHKKMYNCINLIAEENIIVKIFLLFMDKKNEHIKPNIILLGEKLSFDFFMYWSSNELYKLIMRYINISKNRLFLSVKKYKSEFIRSYELKINILKKIYVDELNNRFTLKYKLENNNIFVKELINDIGAINLKFNYNDN